MLQPDPVVFLLDVDNTLLDNDQVVDDLKHHLTQAFGVERQGATGRSSRSCAEVGYADYLGALQRYRAENPRDPHFLQISFYLWTIPSPIACIPAALDMIERIKSWGPTVILSDGDVVFQPRKVERSGLSRPSRATC